MEQRIQPFNPGFEFRKYVSIPVLLEHEKLVKAYINCLIGSDLIRDCYPELALYPEVYEEDHESSSSQLGSTTHSE